MEEQSESPQLPREARAPFERLNFPADLGDVRDKIADYLRHSATLRGEVEAATRKDAIAILGARELAETPRGEWRPATREIALKLQDSPLNMASILVFELINAAVEEPYRDIHRKAANGEYEVARTDRDSEAATTSQTAAPDPAALEFARAIERLEWATARRHHEVFSELAAAGLADGTAGDDYAVAFQSPSDGEDPPWADFENFFQRQWDAGHVDRYIDKYTRSYRPPSRRLPQQSTEVDLDEFEFEESDDALDDIPFEIARPSSPLGNDPINTEFGLSQGTSRRGSEGNAGQAPVRTWLSKICQTRPSG
jgi:hypothetical protein